MNLLTHVDFIVVHCAATKSDQDITVDHLYQWHVNERGWSDVGYHFYVKFDGSFYPCRDINYQGAHCKAINSNSIAICLEGGFDGLDNFTEIQLLTLKHLIKTLKTKHSNAAVVGHSHFDKAKQCPSFDVVAWWDSFNG